MKNQMQFSIYILIIITLFFSTRTFSQDVPYCDINFQYGVEPITLVKFATLNNSTSHTINGTPELEDFTELVPTEVVKGINYNITLKGNTNGSWTNFFKVFVDFNHNGILDDDGEGFQIGYITNSTGLDQDEVSGEIHIPETAINGITLMRVLKLNTGYDAPCHDGVFDSSNPYEYGFGQAEDYLLNIIDNSPCSGTPAIATILTEETDVCNTVGILLSLDVHYTDLGISYQWQNSGDGINFVDISGATMSEYETPPITETIWFRTVVTCSGNSTSTTMPIEVTSTGSPCICDIEFVGNVEPITHVHFADMDNSSSSAIDGSPSLEDYTYLPPANVNQGSTYTATIQGNTNGPGIGTYFNIFIDFNHNGNLNDANESFQIGSIIESTGEDGIQVSAEITIPSDALLGLTRMRVVKHLNAFAPEPCTDNFTYNFGQAEDYYLNITTPELFDHITLTPGAISLAYGSDGALVYTQAYEPGITEGPGVGEGVVAWIGINDENTDPSTWSNDSWQLASYNEGQIADNDEFILSVGASALPGTYYYASRWQLNSGQYIYGGHSTNGGGEWDGIVNFNGALTIYCATLPPTAISEQNYCSTGTISDLVADGEGITWYTEETGGEILAEDYELTDGTIYYASQNTGCESSERTPVKAVKTNIVLDEFPSVISCNEFQLPQLLSGNYYTQSGGLGEILESGDIVTNSSTIYIYREEGLTTVCSAETSFLITITSVDQPIVTQEQIIEVTNEADAVIGAIPVEAEGIVIWYSNVEDAVSSENPLSLETVITSGTYYVTQLIDGCQSEPLQIVVEVLLDNRDLNAERFSYYPNPVNDVLNLCGSKNFMIEIYSILGQKLLSKTISQGIEQIDMSNFAPGNYHIKVYNDNSSQTIKIVKN